MIKIQLFLACNMVMYICYHVPFVILFQCTYLIDICSQEAMT